MQFGNGVPYYLCCDGHTPNTNNMAQLACIIHMSTTSVNRNEGNVAIYKDLNLEFVTKNSFSHEFAARKCN